MKPDNPSPAAHLVRYGVAIARGGFRVFLRHAWTHAGVPSDSDEGSKAASAFGREIEQPHTLLSVGLEPFAVVLANALRRVARIFADEGLARCIAGSNASAPVAAVLNDFAPLCAAMDVELEVSGFAVRIDESDAAILEGLLPYLPHSSASAGVGAVKVWLPALFSGLMNASLWREIVRVPDAFKIAAEQAGAFFAKVLPDGGVGLPELTVSKLEEAIREFPDASIGVAISNLASMLESNLAREFEARAVPFLRAAFAVEVPPAPVSATVVPQAQAADILPVSQSIPAPAQETLVSVKASAIGASHATQVAGVEKAHSANPLSPAHESGDEAKRELIVLPPPKTPPVQPLRPVSKPQPETPKPGVQPIIPPPDDDDDELENVEKAAIRDVRWIVAGIGIALIGITIFAVFGRGLFSGSIEGPLDGPVPGEMTAPAPEPARTGPEKIVVNSIEPLAEPVAVAATPVPPLRLFEHAQAFIESAARAKASGDNRQSAEDLSRALLLFKQELGESRWKDSRYVELRAQYRAQLELLEFSKEQISAIEETLGAREPVEAEPAGEPGLAKMTALFKRGDEEVTNGRPRAAAEAYESGLRSGMEVLGERHLTDRAFQAHLSRYIDFLIGENLDPEELQGRLLLVRKGKKPGPLPAKRTEPESGGLGLPKL
jgi:hypothetical protein